MSRHNKKILIFITFVFTIMQILPVLYTNDNSKQYVDIKNITTPRALNLSLFIDYSAINAVPEEVSIEEQRQATVLSCTGMSRGGLRETVKEKIITKITQRDTEFNETTPEDIKEDIADTIILESYNSNANPLTIASMIDVESQFRITAKSEFGASGLMQIMPSTAKYVAEKIGLVEYDLSDYHDNIKIGVHYYVFDCVEAWSHNNITQIHPNTGEKMSPYEMGLMTYNGNTKTARRMSNIEYMYLVEETLKTF